MKMFVTARSQVQKQTYYLLFSGFRPRNVIIWPLTIFATSYQLCYSRVGSDTIKSKRPPVDKFTTQWENSLIKAKSAQLFFYLWLIILVLRNSPSGFFSPKKPTHPHSRVPNKEIRGKRRLTFLHLIVLLHYISMKRRDMWRWHDYP